MDALPRGIETVIGDLQEPSTLARAMVGVHTVFHLAAAFRQAHLSYDDYVTVNVTATGALVFAAAAAGVRRFVHVSTVGVHGDITGIANEDAPFRPGDWYQETKARGETLARDLGHHKHLPLTVIRPSGIYGPGDMRFLPLFRSVATGRFVMIGRGQVHYHPTYIDDLVDGLIRCADTAPAANRTYILAGAVPVTLNEFVETIAMAAGVSLRTRRWPAAPLRHVARICERVCRPLGIKSPLHQRRVNFFVTNRAFDISRAVHEVGFHPSVSLLEGVTRTLHWYQAHQWL